MRIDPVNTDQLIAKLDELIAATRSAAIPANMRWLSAESMAAMLDMSPRQFAERLACKPGFPNPRAWIVTKQGMTGDLYDALAWDNGGKPLGVSVNTPVPMYDDAAIREMIVVAHFVADLRAVFSLNECGFTELMNAAIQAQEDAVRYRWMLDHASAEEWREWGKMDAYDDVERAIDEAMRQAAELGNGVGIMK